MIRKFKKTENHKTTIIEIDTSRYIMFKETQANYKSGNRKDSFKLGTKRDMENKIKELLRSGFIEI